MFSEYIKITVVRKEGAENACSQAWKAVFFSKAAVTASFLDYIPV